MLCSLVSRANSKANYCYEILFSEGEFGVIYKGYFKSDMMDTVAIKTLKGK